MYKHTGHTDICEHVGCVHLCVRMHSGVCGHSGYICMNMCECAFCVSDVRTCIHSVILNLAFQDLIMT